MEQIRLSSAVYKALFFSQPGAEVGVVIGEEANGPRPFLFGKRTEEGKLALLPAAVPLAVCVKEDLSRAGQPVKDLLPVPRLCPRACAKFC